MAKFWEKAEMMPGGVRARARCDGRWAVAPGTEGDWGKGRRAGLPRFAVHTCDGNEGGRHKGGLVAANVVRKRPKGDGANELAGKDDAREQRLLPGVEIKLLARLDLQEGKKANLCVERRGGVRGEWRDQEWGAGHGRQ